MGSSCDNPRDHGLGPSGTPLGAPVATPAPEAGACPNCGCRALHTIQVPIAHPLVRGGRGTCTYLGCPACPWASPAITTTTATPGRNQGEEQTDGEA